MMKETTTNKLLLTFDEASSMLSISLAMMRKLARSGRIQVVRIGRSVRVPKSEVMRLCGAGDSGEAGR
jgi:excisionase family DNA binding protein